MRIIVISLLLIAGVPLPAAVLRGQLTDPQGKPVAQARVRLMPGRVPEVSTGADGTFVFAPVPSGDYQLAGSAPGFVEVRQAIHLSEGQVLTVNLQFGRLGAHSDAVTVTADVKTGDVQNPDPAQRVLVRDEILDANPGRPGAPVSIPGLPIETASGGIKAPQYFSPGVAGDHGEPIAMFLRWAVFCCRTT